METIRTLYAQQLDMHGNRVRKAKNRIVSIEEPWVRPVVRGKTHANTEFGAKVRRCIEDG